MEPRPELETNPGDIAEGCDVKVYVTTSGLTTEQVNRLLENDSMPDTELFDIEYLNGYTTQQLCKHHCDHHPLGTRGVLVVTLRADYHGLPDAVRQLPSYAAMCAGSLSIGNSDWQPQRTVAFSNSQEGQEPIPHFILYNLLPENDRDAFNKVAQAIDEGIHEIDGNTFSGDADASAQYDPEKVLERYHPVTPENKDLDEISTRHGQLAADLGLDANRFAVVDQQRENEGTLLVQVEPKDQFRCKGPSDGELLWWISISFMTWDDAKEFASRPPFTKTEK
ncbi:hypothetical protein PT974_07735 [Cladobotryum mycophilum]|uniref:Uncharacterized protein n=1 Tax=Cladobotryum mycophilum TaxID=491253 RepID=A0ABR0SHR6_9HYPO